MFYENQFRDNQPLGRIGGMPVYLTTIIVAAIVVGLVVSAFAGIMNAMVWFAFDPAAFWRQGQVWRLLSYLIVDQVNFFTLFSLFFLYSFGRNCEQEMGRNRYLVFLALLIVSPALAASLLWLLGYGGGVMGTLHLSMGLIIAFATIYPNVEWFASIPLKFVAMACVFLAAVGHVGQRDFIGLGCTLATCAMAFGYIRAIRSGFFSALSWSALFQRKPKLRVLPDLPAEERNPARSAKASAQMEMDALLDKIAHSGLNGLTAKERARLETLRENLLRK
jgi:membrane associated rhomboid family serine protease